MGTKLRSLKNQRLALSASGDEIGAKQVQKTINAKQKEYRVFCEKNGLTPQTGAAITVPASKAPAFKAGRAFKNAVNKKG